LAHIAREDAERAAVVYARIDQATAHLRNHPAMGRPGRIPGTRELVIPRTPFVAIYVVERGVVRIVSLHHTAQEWPTEL
jgi:plasmid stabilization system protein ParE